MKDIKHEMKSMSYCWLCINKSFGNVNLHSTDCPYHDFVNYSTKNHLFLPHLLDSRNTIEREPARKIVRNFLKHVAEMSN